ncbi:MAG: hypothetical protein LBN09_03190 [Clostridioides sp.]|nr:hypothetical protein [Clostridioides sp.]
MGVNRMQGTPWHVETIKRRNGGRRRHISRCKYYDGKNCTKNMFKCFGSAHCGSYRELTEEELKIRRNEKSKAKAKLEEEPYWF